MFSKISIIRLLLIFLSFLLFFSGLIYLIYLQFVFPKLIPYHGSGERFTLDITNDYAYQISWLAFTKLHLTLQANNTVQLYVNREYVCDCTRYDLVIEPGTENFILLKSNHPVSGMFTARQEIPLVRQLLAFILFLSGLIGVITSIKYLRVN